MLEVFFTLLILLFSYILFRKESENWEINLSVPLFLHFWPASNWQQQRNEVASCYSSFWYVFKSTNVCVDNDRYFSTHAHLTDNIMMFHKIGIKIQMVIDWVVWCLVREQKKCWYHHRTKRRARKKRDFNTELIYATV